MERPADPDPAPAGWPDLPDEIIEQVYENLSADDYVRLGQVGCIPVSVQLDLLTRLRVSRSTNAVKRCSSLQRSDTSLCS